MVAVGTGEPADRVCNSKAAFEVEGDMWWVALLKVV